ncbi:hypothetical protein KQ313_11950 [Synechococcus sp. CS-1325]|uniref:hypothetical protein n=1 Tax=Synechococcus sp. CS-1325 TaxID=2847979 RepID=UPI000DB1A7B2|nr:hypothetical protein [Synechococcus sp. CS-1325]MCT0200389.1 hypothetical protein [Synechococcus sp. CS-1325]PZU96882.1 MAG: hypothetical protein DCF24_13355 [Cyanobium sp.]
MSFDAQTLIRLLPAIHRIRDAELASAMGSRLSPAEVNELVALEGLPTPSPRDLERIQTLRDSAGSLLSPPEQAELLALEALLDPIPDQQARLAELQGRTTRGPLESLLEVFAGEFAVVEENLSQLYDDLFIETCADWVIPYIGDLIGYEPLHGLGQARGLARAEVAHTIALRRRKGTAAALEQLARDVTGWDARAVEHFELLASTQYMNHLRPQSHYAADLRRSEPLARIGGPFDRIAHTLDVRSIESGRGRFNIPNVGIHLWRIAAYRHTLSPAVRVDELDDRRWLVSPLGHPLQLYTWPQAEAEIAHLADPINVPEPIGRRTLADHLALYYGNRPSATGPLDNPEPSIRLFLGDDEIPRTAIVACDLRDHSGGWAHEAPSGMVAIDPLLGRIAVSPDLLPLPAELRVTYHYGFSTDLGGGEYDRPRRADAAGTRILQVPRDHATIAAALADLGGEGVVEISNSGRYEESLSVVVQAHGQVTLRAAPQCRPTLILQNPLMVTAGEDSIFTLDGLLISGGPVVVPNTADNQLARLCLFHTTLVPGGRLDAAGNPASPGASSIVVDLSGVGLELEHTIVGALQIAARSSLSASDSIVDANDPSQLAYTGPQGTTPGGLLSLAACTVIGRIEVMELGLVSNSLLLARALPGPGSGPSLPAVHVHRRGSGCVRFSYLPPDSLTPRRHHCQPEGDGSAVSPRLASLQYGLACYCQLAPVTPDEIRRGADDEGEMGAFHGLYPAQREEALTTRLSEFLRVGLSAGIFYAT